MTAIENQTTPEASNLNNRNVSRRLTFLDLARGMAVVIMLQGHVFDSFNRPDLRTDGPFMLSQFMGGIGPAIFLVLTGITLAFLMDRREPAHQRFGDFAPLVRGQRLALQHIGKALLDGLHERIDHQGVVDPHLPNFGNAHQVGMIEVLRSFQARHDLIRVRKRLRKADGSWDGSRI